MQFKEWFLLESTNRFSCVLANLPDQEAKSVLAWGKKHISNKDVDKKEGRELEPHITILYGLHAQNTDEIKDLIKNATLEATLGIISKFSTHPDYDVLKIEVESKYFSALNKKLKSLPYTSTHPGYKAHCTLSYVKKGSCEDLVGNDYFKGKKIRFNNITFSNADGKKTNFQLKTL